MDLGHSTAPRWLRDAMDSRSSRETCVTSNGGMHVRAARVKVPGAIVRAWWRVRLPLEVGFLGFGHDMPWSTSVVLASSGEAWICADLIS